MPNQNLSEPDAVVVAAIEEAATREPQPTDYGFCAYGDAHPSTGGGSLWFHWFKDKDTLLDFLRKHSLFLYPTSHIDFPSTLGAVSNAVDANAGYLLRRSG